MTPCPHRKSRPGLFTLAATLLLSACASLQSIDLPDEAALPPVEDAFWSSLKPDFEGDWYYLLNDGSKALDWRLTAIDTARESIDIQTFLLGMDAVGVMILDHLVAAADRGVRVRFMIDDSFLQHEDPTLMVLQQHANFDFRVFNPYLRRGGGAMTRMALNLGEFHRLDHRMHNKAMVVDNEVAIVGGRNLADEYFGFDGGLNFRDMELLVGGPIVQKVSNEFDEYWNDDWSYPLDLLTHAKPDEDELIKARGEQERLGLVHKEQSSGERQAQWEALMPEVLPGSSTLLADRAPVENPALASEAPVQTAQNLVALMDGAREEIIMVSAYFIPNEVLEDMVHRAEERGVQVSVLTNSIRSNNHLSAHSAYRNHINTLLSSGADIYEVKVNASDRPFYIFPPVEDKVLALHAKTIVVDSDKVFIGSANLDPRSMKINTEMGLVVESAELNAALREALAPDFEGGNAWNVRFDEDGKVIWVSDDEVLTAQPAGSAMQRLEDWFFSLLPIEDEL